MLGVFVHRVKYEKVQRSLPNCRPVASVGRVLYLIKNAVNPPLESLAGHAEGILTAGETGVHWVRWLEALWGTM